MEYWGQTRENSGTRLGQILFPNDFLAFTLCFISVTFPLFFGFLFFLLIQFLEPFFLLVIRALDQNNPP